ncbi:hypothetical protein ACFZDG_18130 [Kitasatospora xanthocidica]|uniref:hypothetical protein n=1 Tax=Kitasatospora xanthocidica TaxID=83382 RepID=UPI0036EC475E
MTGRHRSRPRDLIGAVLLVSWAAAHLAVFALLGTVTRHQLTGEPLPEVAATLPDIGTTK